jgi:hypothetical protein
MIRLNPGQKRDYFERSYKAVDGLWFMKAEAAFGFDKTLDIDAEVWKVMPKIQARHLKQYSKSKDPVKSFLECFTAKLEMEGFKIKSVDKKDPKDIRIVIRECPWVALMVKSGREKLAAKVGERICNTEYAVWAEEFQTGLSFQIEDHICRGDGSCVLRYFKKIA